MNVRAVHITVDGITLELEPGGGGAIVVYSDDVDELREIVKAAELLRSFIIQLQPARA